MERTRNQHLSFPWLLVCLGTLSVLNNLESHPPWEENTLGVRHLERNTFTTSVDKGSVVICRNT